MWTHSVASDVKPELLQDMPDLDKLLIGGTNGTSNTHPANSITTTTTASEQSDESNAEAATETKENNKQRTANGE